MIQELLGGALLMEEKKIPASNFLLMDPSPSPSPMLAAANPPPHSTSSSASAEPQQNLRCPRCDSTNTKFCYYNNYNLTQPRHFCKTCRRYWTKGGALRNVPIGGGCRKAKPSPTSLSSSKTSGNKLRGSTLLPDSTVLGKLNLSGIGPFESGSMDLWPPTVQTSNLMALLRSTQNPNPNSRIKEESGMIGSYLVPDSILVSPPIQVSGDPFSSLWKSGSGQYLQYHHQQQPQQGVLFGEAPSSGLHELYQKLRMNHQTIENTPELMGNVGSSTTAGGSIMDPIPINIAGSGGDQLGFWNNLPLAWSDMPAANGAFP